jgi:hypothetical protein
MESTDVYGLVRRDEAEHLRDILTTSGLHDEDVAIRPVTPGRYRLHDEMLRRDGAHAGKGFLLGAVVGAVVGVVAVLAILQLEGTLRVVFSIAAIAGFAGLVGAMVGLQRVETNDDDPVSYREVGEGDDLALIEVHDEHWAVRAHRIMARHGVEFVDEPTPV